MALFKILGRQKLKRVIADYRKVIRDLKVAQRKFLRDAAKIAKQGYRRQFARRGAEFGSPWRRRAATTRQRYERGGEGGGLSSTRVLQKTTKMLASIVRHPAQRIQADRLTLESNARTADGRLLVLLHTAGGRHLPRRRVIIAGTGLGGRALLQLERRWNDLARERVEALGGDFKP